MKKNILLALCVSFMQLCVYAQTIKISDKTSLQPIVGAVITSKNITVVTDAEGNADITNLKGSDSISIKMVGYGTTNYSYASFEGNQFSILLSSKSYDIDEVVISASRFEEKKRDVAQQVQVINARELAFMNQQTTAEVLSQTGNVLVQKSQLGGGSPIIRGFEANKVLMVVDGVRMNNAIFRGGHLQNVLTMDNTILDKTEIVFGPGSVVYGSDALGGVMHFHTKNAQLASGDKKSLVSANAFTRYATAYEEKTGHVDFNIGFKKVAFLTSLTYSDFGDLHQGTMRPSSYGNWGERNFYVERINDKDSMVANSNVNINKGTGYKQYDFLEKILIQQSEKVSHVLNFQYSTTSNIPRFDRLTEVDSKGVAKSAEWYYGPQQRVFGSYSLNLNGGTGIYNKGRVVLAMQDIEESRHNRNYRSANLNHRVERVKVYSINADFSKALKGSHELRYGLEGVYNDVNSTALRIKVPGGAAVPLDTRYPDGGSTMQSIAVYATHSWEITKKLILNDGLRYSNINLHAAFNDKTFFPFPFDDVTQKSSAVNGNLGLVYMPGADWRFTLLGSSGFRAPNVDDMTKVFESVGGRLVVPNPAIKPEYTYNGEVGVSKIISKKIKVEGTGYYTLYKNALTSGKATFNGADSVMYSGTMSAVYTTVNKAEAFLYGFNAGIFADITDALTLTSTINYTYGRIKTDTTAYPLDHIPPMFGRTGINYTMKKLRVELFALYNGAKLAKDYNLGGEDNQLYSLDPLNGKSPAWYTINLRTAYTVTKNVQVQFAVENILDSYYRVFASGMSAPGRNLVVTLRGRF